MWNQQKTGLNAWKAIHIFVLVLVKAIAAKKETVPDAFVMRTVPFIKTAAGYIYICLYRSFILAREKDSV